jgi:hypothetical protein
VLGVFGLLCVIYREGANCLYDNLCFLEILSRAG